MNEVPYFFQKTTKNKALFSYFFVQIVFNGNRHFVFVFVGQKCREKFIMCDLLINHG